MRTDARCGGDIRLQACRARRRDLHRRPSGIASLSTASILLAIWLAPFITAVAPLRAANAQTTFSSCDAVQGTSIAGFQRWLTSGGGARAGLSGSTLATLDTSTRALLVSIGQVCTGVEAVRRDWSDLSQVPIGGLSARIPGVIAKLDTLNKQGQIAAAAAVSSKVELAKALPLIDRAIDTDQIHLQVLNAQLQGANAMLTAAEANLQRAREELDGGKGFLNGFLTAITIGIYNPLQDNINQATSSIALINLQRQQINARLQETQATQAELRAKRDLLQVLSGMDNTITGFQNTIHAAAGSLSAALDHLSHSGQAATQGAAEFYMSRVRADMKELSAWSDRFRATLQQFASNGWDRPPWIGRRRLA